MSEISTIQNKDAGLTVIQRVELDTQIATAKAYPRNSEKVFNNSLKTATLNIDIAEKCTYSVPRGKGTIEGESIRLAEIIAGEWGNLQMGTRVLGVTGKFIEAEAVVWDLESNNRVTVRETRRVTNRDGSLYGEDMIQTTGKAAASIALRNAIFKMVPRSFTLSIMERVREYISNAMTNSKEGELKINKALSSFEKKGVGLDVLLKILDKEKREDLNSDDFVTLTGMWNALKDGIITIQEILDPSDGEVDLNTGEIKSKGQSILGKIKGNAAKQNNDPQS